MNKYITCLLVVVFTISISAAVLDLPDIEICGPSSLKSVLEKKGNLLSELYMPDVMDSLKPIIPIMPFDEAPNIKKPVQKNNAIDLNIGYPGVKAGLLLSDVFLPSSFLTGYADYYTPEKEWDNKNAAIGLHYISKVSWVDLDIGYLDSNSPKLLSYQSDSNVQIKYDFNYNYELAFPFKVKLCSAFNVYQNKIDVIDKKTAKQFWNNNLVFKYLLSKNYEIGLDAAYIQNSPLVSLNITRASNDNDDLLSFAKGISISATDMRFMPGISLSKRFYPFNGASLLLNQESVYYILQNRDLLQKQPWQYCQKDAIVTFNPINTHASLTYCDFKIADIPLNLFTDIGIEYSIDKPVLKANSASGELPVPIPETLLESCFKSGFSMQINSIKISQTLSLNKGWEVKHDYQNLCYLPFFSSETLLDYIINRWKFDVAFNQYYATKDENKDYLRDALDLNAGIEYHLSDSAKLYLKMSNPFDKGQIMHNDIPDKPFEIKLGAFYAF